MKLSASFFALTSVWRSAHGQEEELATFLRGSGSDAGAAASEGYGRSNERHVQSLFEEVEEDLTSSIVGGGPVDPQEYKVRSYDFHAAAIKPNLPILSNDFFCRLRTSSPRRVVLCLVKRLWSLPRGAQCGAQRSPLRTPQSYSRHAWDAQDHTGFGSGVLQN